MSRDTFVSQDTLDEDHLKVAESRLSRVLKIDSTNIEAQNMIGLVYVVTKRQDLAFETWRNLLKVRVSCCYL